jgi:hypothetical protein
VDFLVHNAASLDKKNKNGSTPLHYCSFHDRTEPAKLLLRAGADLQIQDVDKHTPLDVAKIRDNKRVEELVSLQMPMYLMYLPIFLRSIAHYLCFSCYTQWKGRKHFLKALISTGT